MYNLFIDDERFPPDDGKDWKIVRSSQEAIDSVKRFGIPEVISFDHDLGGDDTSIKFINWLVDAVLDGEVQMDAPFEYVVHSQNPIGVRNIEGKLQSFFRHILPKTESCSFKQFFEEEKKDKSPQ